MVFPWHRVKHCASLDKMVRITEKLMRKRSEHNEGIIGTLEELSLHQEDIDKIEHLNNWCKNLQILYLQANLISKIENLYKLKSLQYLNLAVNNIEVVENLQGCESLEKLDLTLNFIGNIESVSSLKHNIFLKDLYLTGNPCTDFDGYRDYIIVQLPQIKCLDVQEVTISERIKAQQNFPRIEGRIKKAQKKYFAFREEQRKRLTNNSNFQLNDEEFWKSTSENSPETRTEIALRARKCKKTDDDGEVVAKKIVKFFGKDGRPLNMNQARLDFTFNDENPMEYVLDIAVYKFLDTNLIDVDLQPIYVTVKIKGKIFQMVFPEEIAIEKSTAQRSQITGHLVLTMPKACNTIQKCCANLVQQKKQNDNADGKKHKRHQYLEVEEKQKIDITNIVAASPTEKPAFQDNLEVPPLEYA